MIASPPLLWSIGGGASAPGRPGSAGAGPVLPAELLAQPVLIIEDEAMIAWMLESLLSDLGFGEIVIAASASQALRAFGEQPPGAIVSDINLGREAIDGIAAVENMDDAAHLPVVFVTAHADAANRARIEAAFPRHAIVAKPVALETLRSALLAALEGPAIH